MQRMSPTNSGSPNIKYFINCNNLKEKEKYNSIEVKDFLKNDNEIYIFKAFVKSALFQKYSNVVLKIGQHDKTILKEYEIGKQLQNVPGFIKYICLIDCFDEFTQGKKKICNASQEGKNSKHILVIPYLKIGSVAKYNWTQDNFHILQSLIKQVLMSCYFAYEKHGFIHNDMHLDNVMIKQTKKEKLIYEDGTEILTHGFLALLIDFDRSLFDKKKYNTLFYWRNIENLFVRLQVDIARIRIKTTQVQDWLEQAMKRNFKFYKTKELLKMIDELEPMVIPPQLFVYDPSNY